MAFDVPSAAHLLAQQPAAAYLACFLRGAWLAERLRRRLLLGASGVTYTANMLAVTYREVQLPFCQHRDLHDDICREMFLTCHLAYHART